MDYICPLKEVHAIVTPENVYINTQKNLSPSVTKWDFESANFRPFLSKAAKLKYFPKGIDSIQPEKLIYEKPTPDFVKRLESRISAYIANKIDEYRSNPENKINQTTFWDYEASDMIKKQLLNVFELYKYETRPLGLSKTNYSEKMKLAENEIEQIKGVKKSKIF